MNAVSLVHHWGWHIFGGGGSWHWPLLVEADLSIPERTRRLLRAKILVDSAAIFGELGGVGLCDRSMM